MNQVAGVSCFTCVVYIDMCYGGRDLTTDMSLNLHLEESTVRSERMTPFKYSTAHIKVLTLII